MSAFGQRCFVFCLLLVLVSPAYSQTLPLTNYTIQNGLPEATVYTVYPDKSGYLWTGTQGGVCSFDGRQFKILDSQLGLPDNHVTAIASLADGTIVFGHHNGAVSLFSPANEHLEKLKFENNALVNDLLLVGRSLYIATLGNGIFCATPSGKTFSIKHLAGNGLPSDIINNFSVKSEHELWISTSKGLAVLDTRTFSTTAISLPTILKQEITTVYQSADNNLWVGTPKGALKFAQLDLDSTPAVIDIKAGLINEHINKIFSDHNGNTWLATRNGIARINNSGIKCFTKANGLLSDLVYDIKEDNEHNIWIGQDDGISCYKDSPFELYSHQDGLIYNEVYKTIEDSKGNFWIATSQGLTLYDPKKNGNKLISNYTVKDGLADNFIYDVFEDSRKNVWIACVNKGVSIYSPVTGKIESYTSANGLGAKEVISINEDKHGHIWLATLDNGVIMYDHNTNHFTNFNTANGFPGNAVWTIHRDKKGTLWFGSRNKGLIRQDTVTDKFVLAPGQEKLVNHNFGSISSDSRGNIWIASIGDGIFKYDGKTYTQYGTRQGIKSNNPYFIFCDNRDRIWLGTNVGIDLFDPVTLTTQNFGKNDGFIGIETNQNAIYQSKDGDLWIGTVNGLMRYRSNSDAVNPVVPKIYITKKYLAFDGTSLASDKLAYYENYINFDYQGISLSNADKMRYSYRLVGLSNKWSALLSESRVSYANLPPGLYSFMVKAGYPGGNWSKPAIYSFSIATPFYKTWWFILLSILFIGYIVFAVYRYRINQYLKLERVRNKIATDLHDDIGSALSSISIFSEVADKQLDNNDGIDKTREMIGHISHYSRNMLDAMDDIVWAVNPKNDHFKDLAVRMREFAIPLLEARKISFDISIPKDLKEVKVGMEVRKNIFLVFKECVNNILKHSGCTEMTASLKKQNNQLEFTIADNGKGFDTGIETNRNGLANIKKRAEEINAGLEIISAPGKGTSIKLLVNTI